MQCMMRNCHNAEVTGRRINQHIFMRCLLFIIKKFQLLLFVTILILVIILLSGCGGSSKFMTKYELQNEDIVTCESPRELSVQYIKMTDVRPILETDIRVRKAMKLDVDFYTYYGDRVASDMLFDHLSYSNVFSKITYDPIPVEIINDGYMDELRKSGIDAVLVGGIKHFYGCYYEHKGMKIFTIPTAIVVGLYTYAVAEKKLSEFTGVINYMAALVAVPSALLAYYILSQPEHLLKRNIQWDTELSLKMINTSTHRVMWEDSCRIKDSVYQAMPNKDKYIVTLSSLRDVVNEIVKRLSKVSFKREGEVIEPKIFGRNYLLDSVLYSVQKKPRESFEFEVEIVRDSSINLFGDKVSLTYSTTKKLESSLSFKGVIGISVDYREPFHRPYVTFTNSATFFLKVDQDRLYIVSIVKDRSGIARIEFNRM